MTESVVTTIRFPKDLKIAIQKCADARSTDTKKVSFSEVVVETCEAKYAEHSIASRVSTLEQQVSNIEARLESNRDYECEQKYR
jgi:hypothetical protein